MSTKSSFDAFRRVGCQAVLINTKSRSISEKIGPIPVCVLVKAASLCFAS